MLLTLKLLLIALILICYTFLNAFNIALGKLSESETEEAAQNGDKKAEKLLKYIENEHSELDRVISLKCTSVDELTPAASMINPMINVIGQSILKFCTANNATFILKDNNDNHRGVAQYIGNGSPHPNTSVGHIDMYIYDSANNHTQAKLMVNNGTIIKIS